MPQMILKNGRLVCETPEEERDREARQAIKQAQFNTIIKNNRNDLLKTIRLLHQFDEQMCEDWVMDEFGEEQCDANTHFWMYCVRQYLYIAGYLDKEQPDVIQNTQGWLEFMMVEKADRAFGYYDTPDDFPEQCTYNFNWLIPQEVELAKKKIAS